MGRIEHGPTFYFEFLALVGFAFSNFDCSIPTCQMEGLTYFFGPTTYQLHNAFVSSILFFCVTFLDGIDFLCFLLVLLLSIFFFSVLLFGNYDKIIQNFGNFSNLHQKYEFLNFFGHHHY
jgi:hypothetical protein